MAVFDYYGLLAHVGHSFECVVYGDKQNVALACNDCHEIIIDFERPDFNDVPTIEALAKSLTENEK